MSLIQHAFRFFNDDGGEATATPYAGENVNIAWPVDTNIRLRLGLTHDGSAVPSNSAYIVLAAPVGSNAWFEIAATGSGKLRLAKSNGSPNNIPDAGQPTSRRLSLPNVSPSPTFVAGRQWDTATGSGTVALANGQCTELEICLQAVSANGAVNGDVYQFRAYRVPAASAGITITTDFSTFNQITPAVSSFSINKPPNTADGDFILFAGSARDGTFTGQTVMDLTAAGFTLLWQWDDAVDGVAPADRVRNTGVWGKIASSEPASYTVNISTDQADLITAFTWRLPGVVAAGFEDGTRSVVNDTGAGSTGSYATTANGTLVIGIRSHRNPVSSSNGTFGGVAATERFDTGKLSIYAEIKATAGVVGAFTCTEDSDVNDRTLGIFGLKAA